MTSSTEVAMTLLSFEERLALIFAVTLAALLFDLRHPKGERHRFGEYSFLFLGAGIGLVFGIGVDAITSRISPDYFVIGKGIAPGETFRREVARLGGQAGASAGVLIAGGLLLANPQPARALRLLSRVATPLFLAIFLGAAFGALQALLGVIHLTELAEDLGAPRAEAFAVVWATHGGIYFGAFLGWIWEMRSLRADAKGAALRCREEVPEVPLCVTSRHPSSDAGSDSPG